MRLDRATRKRKEEGIDESGIEDIREEAEALGVPLSVIEDALEEIEQEEQAEHAKHLVDIWPESIPTLHLWNEVGHMWVWGAMGGRICLRWETIKAFCELRDLRKDEPTDPDCYAGIAVLERTIIANQNARDDDEKE